MLMRTCFRTPFRSTPGGKGPVAVYQVADDLKVDSAQLTNLAADHNSLNWTQFPLKLAFFVLRCLRSLGRGRAWEGLVGGSRETASKKQKKKDTKRQKKHLVFGGVQGARWSRSRKLGEGLDSPTHGK